MKMEPVFPKAELALFLTVRTVAGSSARSLQTAHAKVDEEPHAEFRVEVGRAAGHIPPPRARPVGPGIFPVFWRVGGGRSLGLCSDSVLLEEEKEVR